MTIGDTFTKNMVVHIRIMFGLVEPDAVVCAVRLFLPVNAEIIAPRIFCRGHGDSSAAAEFSESCVFLQVLRLTIC